MSIKIGADISNFSSLRGSVSKSSQKSMVKSEVVQTRKGKAAAQSNSVEGNLKKQDIQHIDRKINSLNLLSQKIQFSFSKEMGMLYVKVIDTKTGTVIGQIPPKAIMRFEESMREMIGVIFDKKE
ncbi:MAG: hypothetical protein IEMM0003_0588 [bacterium]|nr:MAG: hypothetical protein IEMM0003_0588 [bacterium]